MKVREDLLDAALRELGSIVSLCDLPSRDSILGASRDSPIEWNPVSSFRKSLLQSEDSYEEQQKVIELCVKHIDRIVRVDNAGSYTKNIIISGFPGGGKTFILMYVGLYALCQGLLPVSTAMMANRAVQLGGIHWHKLLCIPAEENMSISRRAEVSINKLNRHPKKLELIRRLCVFLSDEKSQHSSETTQCIDLILRRSRNINLLNGGILEIATMDHSQLQPIKGRPFLTSPNVIPCYTMVSLKNSVRAHNDPNFYRLQQITRMKYSAFEENPELIDEFKALCEGFTFVDSWNDPLITPSTFRCYAMQVPAKEAARNFLATVRALIPANLIRHAKSLDYEKRRTSRLDWALASESTSTVLESKVKEPRDLLFFRGAIYQCTYNQDEKFNQSQLAFCFELPQQDDLDLFRPVRVLLFPTTLKFEDFSFDPNATKDHYINQGFVEISMGVSPERIKYLNNDVQAFRKQYGLKHHVSGTIHSIMGDTKGKLATSTIHRMWCKGQLVVICSRTRRQEDTIFVGNKNETIEALAQLLEKRTMWCDYMEHVIDIISDNTDEKILHHSSFPYRICDISLPQAQTGYVFFMKSQRDDACVYIDSTNCLRTRLLQHNQGFDSSSHPPAEKRPFVLVGYICGFDRDIALMDYVKVNGELSSIVILKNGSKMVKMLSILHALLKVSILKVQS